MNTSFQRKVITMTNIRTDFGRVLGPVKPMHDVGGNFADGLFVDIPNIFRDFDADETDPANYDFVFTDWLIQTLMSHHVEPVFRLGVSIENYCKWRAYRIFPPKDNAKWAHICEHVIRHYNEGWADGFRYGITYWEIWNEPDHTHLPQDNQMWQGTPEEYFELYDTAAKHLKACFGNTIKVGGFASCGFYGIFLDPEKYGLSRMPNKPYDWEYSNCVVRYRVEFFYRFFRYIKEHGSRKALLVTNVSGAACEFETDLDGDMKVFLIDKDNLLAETDFDPRHFTLADNQCALIKSV